MKKKYQTILSKYQKHFRIFHLLNENKFSFIVFFLKDEAQSN